MGLPAVRAIPPVNSIDWYGHYTDVDTALRAAAAQSDLVAVQTATGSVQASVTVSNANFTDLALQAPKLTGTAATDTANLQAAIVTAQASNRDLHLRPGTYTLTAPITWNLAQGAFIGRNTVIDASNLTVGPALTVTGQGATTALAHRGSKHSISGFELIGPDNDSTTVDGIFITDTAGADQGALEHLVIYGFRDSLSYGTNTWCVLTYKVTAGHFHRYGVNLSQQTNSGENQQFLGCTFYSSNNNASGTATAVSITGNCEGHFSLCSFDYNGYEAVVLAGAARFFGCHFENNTVGHPMVRAQQGVVSSARTDVEFHGCSFATTETGPNRPLVEIMAGSGVKLSVSWFGGLTSAYNSPVSLYVNNSSVVPRIRHDGVYLDDSGATAIGSYGVETNMVAAPSFESTAFAAAAPGVGAWAHGGTVTYSLDTANPRSGTTALKIVGAAGGATSSASQRISIPTGRRPLAVAAWMAATAWTSGSVICRVAWYGVDGTTVIRTDSIGQNGGKVAAVQGYLPYATTLTPPAGAAQAEVQFYCSNDFAGTVYVDDVGIWAL